MPHAWPSPDPIVQDMQTFKIAAEQPYIHRLTRLGVEAERRGQGIEFAREVSHLLFGGTRDWHLGEHLAGAAQRAGLDLAAMDAAIAEPAGHDAAIDANQQALAAVGPLGRADLRLRRRALLRRGPHRHAALAAGQARLCSAAEPRRPWALCDIAWLPSWPPTRPAIRG